nr:hypothetical protein [Tanacetum cinerariifolium]
EEAGIQLQAKEFDLMAAAADLNEIEEVNANYILMANLQQASTSGLHEMAMAAFESQYIERLKADNTNLASHLPRACLMLARAGFPSSLLDLYAFGFSTRRLEQIATCSISTISE